MYFLTKFSDLGLAEPILHALETEGYAQPTPIQIEAIPVSMTGADILGIAQTGTGKTASFVLPILDKLARNDRRPSPKACDALILAPTRELVAQIAENIRKYSRNMRVSVTIVVGGVKPAPQIRKLASGSHIVVATPGRLLDHMNNGHLTLGRTKAVVLDEADHMLDLGFIPDIRRIMKHLPKERQTSLFSATMPSQIRALAKDFQRNPAEIAVATVSRPIERIEQSVRHVHRDAKRHALTAILKGADVDRAIVFTRTKRGADRVSQHLQKAGLMAAAIHGNKSQSQRVKALQSFKSGETAIMVATDIAARGIDIDDVSHVVNFELPEVPEAYVHRIGRTARAGRTGTAVSLCEPSEVKLLRGIEKLIGNSLPTDDSAMEFEGFSPMEAVLSDAPQEKSRKSNPRKRRGASAQNDNRADSQAKRQADGRRDGKANGRGKANGQAKSADRQWSPMETSASASSGASAQEGKGGRPSNGGQRKRFGDKPAGTRFNGERANGERSNGARAGASGKQGAGRGFHGGAKAGSGRRRRSGSERPAATA